MKNSLLSVLCLLLFAASCALEEGEVSNNKGMASTTISVFAEDPADIRNTKVGFDSNNNIVWKENDQITVIGSGNNNSAFTLSDGYETTRGSFSGTLPEKADEKPYYAISPTCATTNRNDNAITFSIPQNFKGKENDIDHSACPMVGTYIDERPVQFKNIFGLLKMTFTSKDSAVVIKRIALHDLGGNMLWGNCSVPINADNDTLIYNNISLTGGTNTIYMEWDTPITIPTGSMEVSCYFPVPVGSLDNGFSLVLYDNDGRAWTFIQKISNLVTAQRSKIIEINPVTLSEKSEPKDVKARGYYKTLFIDGAKGLNHLVNRDELPWISAAGFSDSDIEYVANGDQNRDYAAAYGVLVKAPCSEYDTGSGYSDVNWTDDNGVLLYPDGEPRFRAVFVNGGTSTTHGEFLTKDGRDHFHNFFVNGGSYVAVCAGTFLASTSVDGKNRYNDSTSENYTFGIWPGDLTHTSMPRDMSSGSVYTDMLATARLGDISTGNRIKFIRHHGGSYLKESEATKYGAEDFFSYQYVADSTVDLKDNYYTDGNRTSKDVFRYKKDASPVRTTIKTRVDSIGIWAYKPSASCTTGRAVLCGSHPESPIDESSPEYPHRNDQISLMRNMLLYALDGFGKATVKDELNMTTNSSSSQKIGDKQYHHYYLSVSDAIDNFRLDLNSFYDKDSGIDLYLAMRKADSARDDNFAWISDADYVLCNKGGGKVLYISKLPAGTWYISVYCATTITSNLTTGNSGKRRFFKYSGTNNELMTQNGIDYTISICAGATKMTTTLSSEANLDNSSIIDDQMFTMDD